MNYLSTALKEKTFLPMPRPEIVGDGLEAIEAALAKYRLRNSWSRSESGRLS